MNIDKAVFCFAGTLILASLSLSQVHNINWLWFTAFIGVNMIQASFSGLCPIAMLFKKLGIKPGNAFN
ncbi:MAG: DUF2892 domain-containing protein [Proteobacteria bacterium]|nr:DUF2892 domain-containing protein [Pseudomonadota bacterium]